jgi:hypothetical protein
MRHIPQACIPDMCLGSLLALILTVHFAIIDGGPEKKRLFFSEDSFFQKEERTRYIYIYIYTHTPTVPLLFVGTGMAYMRTYVDTLPDDEEDPSF